MMFDHFVIRIVAQAASPSERIIGPFHSVDEAENWLDLARRQGRWDREQWQSPQVMPLIMESPYQPGEIR